MGKACWINHKTGMLVSAIMNHFNNLAFMIGLMGSNANP